MTDHNGALVPVRIPADTSLAVWRLLTAIYHRTMDEWGRSAWLRLMLALRTKLSTETSRETVDAVAAAILERVTTGTVTPRDLHPDRVFRVIERFYRAECRRRAANLAALDRQVTLTPLERLELEALRRVVAAKKAGSSRGETGTESAATGKSGDPTSDAVLASVAHEGDGRRPTLEFSNRVRGRGNRRERNVVVNGERRGADVWITENWAVWIARAHQERVPPKEPKDVAMRARGWLRSNLGTKDVGFVTVIGASRVLSSAKARAKRADHSE